MSDIRPGRKLTFDDISLVPQYSTIRSRDDIDLSRKHSLLGATIISANMATVTGTEMVKALKQPLAIGCLHRFQSVVELGDQLSEIAGNRVITSVGVGDWTEIKTRVKLALGHGQDIVCIDVAHGHHELVGETLKFLRVEFGEDLTIIAGNVCTREGAVFLRDHGADIIKVGVGPGSHCTTRVVTGHGVPQATAVMDVVGGKAVLGYEVIADGGIKTPGDVAKALALGADYVMIGKLFAGCSESPAKVVKTDKGLFKQYRGSASRESQEGKANPRVEGVQSLVPYTGPVSEVLQDLENGLRSAMSYSGCRNMIEFNSCAEVIEITTSAYLEGTPHGA